MSTIQEQTKFWCDPVLDNLEMLRATYVTHTFSRHTHEGYAIGVIESGVEEFTYQGAVHRAPAGSVVVIHPGEVHTGYAGTKAGWTYRMLYPNVTLIQKAVSELVGSGELQLPYFPNPVIHDRQLAAQLQKLHVAIENSTSPLERESRFVWTLAQMLTKYATRRPYAPIGQEHQVVQHIQDYLKANYINSISLQQLSRIANLKPLRLLRVFRKEVGLPPHTYLVQVRVARAKTLLSMKLPIAQVAADTGFTDQSHLTRHFKRLVGVTPRKYALGCCKNVQDLLI